MIFFMLPCLQNNIICFILLSLKFLMKTYGKLHQMFICSLLIVVSWEIHWMFLFRSLCKLKKKWSILSLGTIYFASSLWILIWISFWIYTHLLMHTACQVCLCLNIHTFTHAHCMSSLPLQQFLLTFIKKK